MTFLAALQLSAGLLLAAAPRVAPTRVPSTPAPLFSPAVGAAAVSLALPSAQAAKLSPVPALAPAVSAAPQAQAAPQAAAAAAPAAPIAAATAEGAEAEAPKGEIKTEGASLFDGSREGGPLFSAMPTLEDARRLLRQGDQPASAGAASELVFALMTQPEAVESLARSGAQRKETGARDAEAAADAALDAYQRRAGKALSHEEYDAARALLLSPGEGGKAPLEVLEDHAVAALTTRELMATVGEARRLFDRYFPGFERAVPVKLNFHLKDSIWGFYELNPEGSHITLTGPRYPLPGREREEHPGPFPQAEPMSGRMGRLVISFHEYGHALFYAHTKAVPEYMEAPTVQNAVNEGFAVLLELVMIDKVVADRKTLGLSPSEVKDLQRWKALRISSLKSLKNWYTEGTLGFWHKIYRGGGEKLMLETLDGLVPERMAGVPLDHPVFMLAAGSPKLLAAFTRAGDQTWEGLLALSNHLAAGTPLSAEQQKAAREALALAQPAALDRYFESVLVTGPVPMSKLKDGRYRHPAGLAPLLRLALLDDAAGKRLAAFIVDRLGRKDPRELLARGPAWVDALLQAGPFLPMDDKTRAGWKAMVADWAEAEGLMSDDSRAARRVASNYR